MDYLLMAVLAILVLVSIAGSFYVAVALFSFGVLVCDEIKIYLNEARPSKAQKHWQEVEWEKFLLTLKAEYDAAPLNVFRDGAHV
jgi:hypothetical protein